MEAGKPDYAAQINAAGVPEHKRERWRNNRLAEAGSRGCGVFRVSMNGDVMLFEAWKEIVEQDALPPPSFFFAAEGAPVSGKEAL
jgi:hypothetical protein